jgi:hypothetical protein
MSISESEWLAIRRAILRPSALEASFQGKNSLLIQALGELGELETITSASFMPTAATPTTAPVSDPGVAKTAAPSPPGVPTRATTTTPTQTPTATVTAPPTPHYRTTHQEYRSALGNQGLVEALLRYHRRTGRTGSKKILAGNSGFSSERIPEVEVETKDSGFRRSTGTSTPVLRSKRDSK